MRKLLYPAFRWLNAVLKLVQFKFMCFMFLQKKKCFFLGMRAGKARGQARHEALRARGHVRHKVTEGTRARRAHSKITIYLFF